MKNKTWFKYLFYFLLILGLVYLDGYIVKLQIINQRETFNIGISYFLISMIIRMIIGFMLGLEYIMHERKKDGNWTINLSKVIFMVLPSLYFSLVLFFYFIPNPILMNILMKPALVIMRNYIKVLSTFQILFGYFFVTSFYRSKDNPNQSSEDILS